MIYVIKTENGDVITFDSILSFSESYRGGVTSHPVEDGTTISDHVTTENVKFRIQGVVSDYNFWNPLKNSLRGIPAYNYPRQDSGMVISPNGIAYESGFVTIPNDFSTPDGDSVKSIADTIRKRLIDIQRNSEMVTLFSYVVGGEATTTDIWPNCIITDLSFDKSPDSGDAIYPNMSLEQIKVVKVKVTQANSDTIIVATISNQAAVTDGKGPLSPPKAKDATQPDPAASKEEKHKPQEDRNAVARDVRDKEAQKFWKSTGQKEGSNIPGTIFQ